MSLEVKFFVSKGVNHPPTNYPPDVPCQMMGFKMRSVSAQSKAIGTGTDELAERVAKVAHCRLPRTANRSTLEATAVAAL